MKFSSNWKKARVQRIYARIANVRRDFLHPTFRTLLTPVGLLP
ncbi:transposase [Meiothermus hypogaeus]|nr:transposase [Meiothermus hypogaeus]